MKKVAMVMIFTLCLATPVLGDELVVNGGFETPVVGDVVCPDQGGWCFTASSNVPGWTVEWVSDGQPGDLEFWRGILGGPQSGDQNVELDTHGRSDARVRIYEDLPTCPGGTYALSYYFRPRPSVLNAQKLEVRWAGNVIATEGPFNSTASTTTWTPRSASLSASTTSTRLEFADTGVGDSLGMLLDSVSVQGCRALPVQIDIKPGSDPNSINCSSKGVIPVAILGSDTVDVTLIDPFSVNLNGAGVKVVGSKDLKPLCHQEYVNGDGYLDLVCQVYTVDFIVEPGDDTATLTATTYDGTQAFIGSDSINIVQDGSCY